MTPTRQPAVWLLLAITAVAALIAGFIAYWLG
jgi:hypothetical protein